MIYCFFKVQKGVSHFRWSLVWHVKTKYVSIFTATSLHVECKDGELFYLLVLNFLLLSLRNHNLCYWFILQMSHIVALPYM